MRERPGREEQAVRGFGGPGRDGSRGYAGQPGDQPGGQGIQPGGQGIQPGGRGIQPGGRGSAGQPGDQPGSRGSWAVAPVAWMACSTILSILARSAFRAAVSRPSAASARCRAAGWVAPAAFATSSCTRTA